MKLGVNIDHVATLRQVRGTSYPSVPVAAGCCVRAGASGITVHLREDRRHIQDADVYALRKSLSVALNLEMSIAADIVELALDVKPDEVCLVPEKREELTTEGGLDVAGGMGVIKPVVDRLSEAGIRVSLFIDPDPMQVVAAHAAGAPVVELHTGTYCEVEDPALANESLGRLIEAAQQAHSLGLQVNAGHGLNLANVGAMHSVPYLDTLNIGHSIVARAVFCGLEHAVREMVAALSPSDD